MCRIMDEIREEGREEGRVENQHSIARAMLLDGLPRELIKKYSQLQDSDLDLLLQSAG